MLSDDRRNRGQVSISSPAIYNILTITILNSPHWSKKRNWIMVSIYSKLSHEKVYQNCLFLIKGELTVNSQTVLSYNVHCSALYLVHVSQLIQFRVQTDCLANLSSGLLVTLRQDLHVSSRKTAPVLQQSVIPGKWWQRQSSWIRKKMAMLKGRPFKHFWYVKRNK